jgi:2,4-dichlorophenol 6-monooxygenase
VLKGQAGENLLDTDEAERRPVDARNIQHSMENSMAHMEAGAAFGLNPAASAEENWTQFRRILSDKPEDAAFRSGALRAIRRLSMEANELNVEYGYRYQSAAVIPDGSPVPEPTDDIRLYEPSTYPGGPLPHARLDDEAGQRLAMKDLVKPGRFLLIAGDDGQNWCAARRGERLADRYGPHWPYRWRPVRSAPGLGTISWYLGKGCGAGEARPGGLASCRSLPGSAGGAARRPRVGAGSQLHQGEAKTPELAPAK